MAILVNWVQISECLKAREECYAANLVCESNSFNQEAKYKQLLDMSVSLEAEE
jgi:hypothetical protein